MKAVAPLIGLPARMDPGKDRQYLSRVYPDAVFAAGGIPVILPLLEDARSLGPVAERLDGLLLTGSDSDLDPTLYGAARLPECGPTQPLRDALDLFLLKTAFARKMPILATCYGLQSLNVFLGGTLIQDIPTALGTDIRHNDNSPSKRLTHPVEVKRESVLASLIEELHPMVNSTHHQAADRVADSLEVIARAPDGVIEALVGTDPDHWVLAVQWHPEKSFAHDAFSRKIFQTFIAQCGAESSDK